MNNVNYLEPVIRPATEYALHSQSTEETVIVIDTARREVVERVGMIHNLIRDLKYFVVSVSTNPQNLAKAAIRLPYTNGLPKDQKLSIILRYEAACERGNERLVAKSLFDGPNPGVVFNDLLARWINEHLNLRMSHFAEDYHHEKTNIETAIANKALQEVGLNLSLDVSVEGLDQLQTVVVGPIPLRVRFMNFDEEDELRATVVVGVDEKSWVKALLNQGESLTDMITKGIQTYFAYHVSLEEFCFELSDVIKPRVKQYLSEVLKPIGRKINSISIDADPQVPRSFRKDFEIHHSHFGYPEPVIIKSSVLMIPNDVVRYRARKSPALDSWAEIALREVIDEALFGVEYIDLLIKFAPLEEKIKDGMNRKSEAIGFVIKQLIVDPHSELVDQLERIDIEIDKENEEAVFQTNVPDCSIRLGIAVTARIKDLKDVSERLKRKQNIPEEMRRGIHKLTKQYLRAIDPERFYMRYSHTDPKQFPQEIPVEKELGDQISKLLANEFCADVTHLTLTRGKTRITDDLARLLKESQDFRVSIPLGEFKGSGAFLVTGTFSVDGVHYNGWKRFQERDSGLERIKKRIEDSIQAELKPISTALILLRDRQEKLARLKHRLVSAAGELILSEFGLVISLTTVMCNFVGIEEDGRRTAVIRAKIAKLEELRIDMLASGLSSEEINGVETQIEVLRNLLASPPPDSNDIELSDSAPGFQIGVDHTDLLEVRQAAQIPSGGDRDN